MWFAECFTAMWYTPLLRIESLQLKAREGETCRGVLLTAARDRTIKYWDIRRLLHHVA